eukprot:Pgem_evm1s6484
MIDLFGIPTSKAIEKIMKTLCGSSHFLEYVDNEVDHKVYLTLDTLENSVNPHCKHATGIGSYPGFKEPINEGKIAPSSIFAKGHFKEQLSTTQPIIFEGIPLSLTYEKQSHLMLTPEEKNWKDVPDKHFIKCFGDFPNIKTDPMYDSFYLKLKDRCTILTLLQGHPLWHWVRRFRITSTLGYILCSFLPEYDSLISEPVNDFWNQLITQGHDEEEETQEALAKGLVMEDGEAGYEQDQAASINQAHTKEDLQKKTTDEIKTKCTNTNAKAFFWHDNKRRKELMQKCCHYTNSVSSLTTVQIDDYFCRVGADGWDAQLDSKQRLWLRLLKSWFLTPFKDNSKRNEVFRAGHENEPKLAAAAVKLFSAANRDNQFDDPIEIKSLKQCGLMASKDNPLIAASKDGLGVLLQSLMLFLFVLEFKTRVFSKTVASERAIAKRVGKFVHVTLTADSIDGNIAQLQEAIPSKPHRIQLLHHIAVTKVLKGLIIYGEGDGFVKSFRRDI